MPHVPMRPTPPSTSLILRWPCRMIDYMSTNVRHLFLTCPHRDLLPCFRQVSCFPPIPSRPCREDHLKMSTNIQQESATSSTKSAIEVSVMVTAVEQEAEPSPQPSGAKSKGIRFWLIFLAICVSLFLSALEFVSSRSLLLQCTFAGADRQML